MLRGFLIVLAGLALLLQPAPYLNDEIAQMASLTKIAEGSLLVDRDLPDGYAPFFRGSWVPDSWVPEAGNSGFATGSLMTNILALPLLFLLRGLAAGFGPMGAAGLLSSGAIGAGMYAWRGRRIEALAAAAAIFGAGVVMQAMHQPPSSPYLEMVSLLWVSMAFHAFAAALIYDLLRTRVSRPGLGTAVYAFATPALLWSLNMKYHGVGISLAAIALWLFQEGHRTGKLRTFLTFAVVGLSLWNHLPTGLILLGSAGIMALPAVLLGIKQLGQRTIAGAAGLAVGLIPDAFDRWAHARVGLRDRFIQVGTEGGESAAAVVAQVESQSEGGRLQWAIWNDLTGPFEAFWQIVAWPDRWTVNVGVALPLLVLAPILFLAIGGRLRWTPLHVWPFVHGILLLGLFGFGALRNGDAFDFRHTATMWPFLALPMANVVSAYVTPGKLKSASMMLVASFAVLVWVPMLLYRGLAGHSVFMVGTSFEYIDPFRYLGLSLIVPMVWLWQRPQFRGWIASFAASWMFLLHAVIQLGPARSGPAGAEWPFVAWPVALLEKVVEWFLLGP